MKNRQSFRLLLLSIGMLVCSFNKTDYDRPKQDISSYFNVERNADNKNYLITTTQPSGDWAIYAGNSPQNSTKKVASGNGPDSIVISEYPVTQRIYFKYVWENNSSAIASERLLPMEGAYNVRDLGGYKTVDGKFVKWGKVFRSGDLNKLTTNDLEYLAGIGLKNIVDFRGNSEIEVAPDKAPSTVVKIYSFPIETGNILDMSSVTTLAKAESLLVDGNKFFVTDCQEQYTKFFQLLMDGNNAPILFHCSAGKDRTGFAAALFLASLGVDRETIINDYLLSGKYVKEKYASYVDADPILAPVFEVKREYIMAAFDVIDSKYHGVDSFLKNQLGVDINRMQALYTE